MCGVQRRRWRAIVGAFWCNLHNRHRSIVLMAITPIWLHYELPFDRCSYIYTYTFHSHMACTLHKIIEHNNHMHMKCPIRLLLKIACSFSGYLFFAFSDSHFHVSRCRLTRVWEIQRPKWNQQREFALIPNFQFRFPNVQIHWQPETIQRITYCTFGWWFPGILYLLFCYFHMYLFGIISRYR